jgi:hypothetical protein
MKPYFAMGLFAFYVFAVFLLRTLAAQEFPGLAALKKTLGRTQGLILHFTANVAVPLVLGIVFLSRGVADFGSGQRPVFAPLHHQAALTHLQPRPIPAPVFVTAEESIRTGEIPILLAAVNLPRPMEKTPLPDAFAWEFSPHDILR